MRTIVYTVGEARGLDARPFDLIGYVLGKMPPEAETLTWLEKELAAGGAVPWRPRETLTKWLDWEVPMPAARGVAGRRAEKPSYQNENGRPDRRPRCWSGPALGIEQGLSSWAAADHGKREIPR